MSLELSNSLELTKIVTALERIAKALELANKLVTDRQQQITLWAGIPAKERNMTENTQLVSLITEIVGRELTELELVKIDIAVHRIIIKNTQELGERLLVQMAGDSPNK